MTYILIHTFCWKLLAVEWTIFICSAN